MKKIQAIALALLLGSMTLVAQSAPAPDAAPPATHDQCKRDKDGKMACCKKNKDGKMSDADCCKKGKCDREKKAPETKS